MIHHTSGMNVDAFFPYDYPAHSPPGIVQVLHRQILGARRAQAPVPALRSFQGDRRPPTARRVARSLDARRTRAIFPNCMVNSQALQSASFQSRNVPATPPHLKQVSSAINPPRHPDDHRGVSSSNPGCHRSSTMKPHHVPDCAALSTGFKLICQPLEPSSRQRFPFSHTIRRLFRQPDRQNSRPAVPAGPTPRADLSARGRVADPAITQPGSSTEKVLLD